MDVRTGSHSERAVTMNRNAIPVPYASIRILLGSVEKINRKIKRLDACATLQSEPPRESARKSFSTPTEKFSPYSPWGAYRSDGEWPTQVDASQRRNPSRRLCGAAHRVMGFGKSQSESVGFAHQGAKPYLGGCATPQSESAGFAH